MPWLRWDECETLWEVLLIFRRVIITNCSAHSIVCDTGFVRLFLKQCHIENGSGFHGGVAFVKVSSACRITEARREKKSYFYSPPSHHHPPLLCTPCTKILGRLLYVYMHNFVCVCVYVCGACMKDWCWPKYLPDCIRPGAHCAGGNEGGKGEGEKEQMPQIEMPINNATSTELTVKGGQDGKERMRLRERGREESRGGI